MVRHIFSLSSIREIYDRESRKGNINIKKMPEKYKNILTTIHDKTDSLNKLRKKSTRDLSETDKIEHNQQIANLKEDIFNLRQQKESELTLFLEGIELDFVNKFEFKIQLDKNSLNNYDHECYHIENEDIRTLIFSKLLCADLTSSFKVKTADRHHIMASIKLLLYKDRPYYIIRTDIKKFYESINQEHLLELINQNPYLSLKTKGCIKSVLNQYNGQTTVSAKECGIPRGISISAALCEIYMRDFDNYIKRRLNVIFYARYVDDIFMILSDIPSGQTLDDIYDEMRQSNKLYGLTLHPKGDSKTTIYEYTPNGTNKKNSELTYLGYKITLNPGSKEIIFSLSDKRYNRLKTRIDKTFKHFVNTYVYSPRKARIDLIDCLNLISGNVSLLNSKKGIKTGLYYSNDLLSNDGKQLIEFDNYLIKILNGLVLSVKPFGTESLKEAYLDKIKSDIKGIKFQERWKCRKTYSFSTDRLTELTNILNHA
jgi:hypothetical protein